MSEPICPRGDKALRRGWISRSWQGLARSASWRAAIGLSLLWLFSTAASAATPSPSPPAARPLTFGILPIGGPSESLDAWRPFLDDMERALHRPVRSVSVSTYEGLAQALAEERIDMAFVSGKLALDAVTRDQMQVIAQLTRGDGSKGYYSVLLVEKSSPLRSVDDLFKRPGKLRYARGEALSVSGYVVPETQLFANRKLDSDTFFASVMVDNHQNNALAVANGEVDVATNNTADMERFATHFPEQNARLRTLWTSSLIPHAVIIIRTDLPPDLRDRITQFVTSYGKGKNAVAELAKLKLIHDISGFAPAGNETLVPFADMAYTLDRRRALSAQWVNDAALNTRLQKLDTEHESLVRKLIAAKP
ncbi:MULTISPECIES: phosphate/phosphite/phosphonate ABC transporter substrate-binding protein [Dyella]|uniref:Phosphate/phosphite/phosphonate ABC transporter substrate-binding protein n=2 Tax=Dyella TaxID=231454 RepID=A0A4R0YMZ1_9GAMM|nr:MULTISPECIES: phosphate/phosphite/phosphonate ABC transporter substrate-binding protein [Dyella]TBR37070.1 phosphate/phosphite/phosphonate ABC transporter substrate-binding protein [Dyella terrae]TCI07841.1 phosphate/phosphite/phosphonate ABC transporter substrate-binding protein [Dyella soli]